jgi:hypothetical protein
MITVTPGQTLALQGFVTAACFASILVPELLGPKYDRSNVVASLIDHHGQLSLLGCICQQVHRACSHEQLAYLIGSKYSLLVILIPCGKGERSLGHY